MADGNDQGAAGSHSGPGPALAFCRGFRLELIPDLVGPETLQAEHGLVQVLEIIVRNAANLFQRPELTLKQPINHVAYFAPFFSEADAYRTSIGGRTLMIHETGLDELLQTLRNVRTQIVAAPGQFSGRDFVIADIVKQQCLGTIEVRTSKTLELILDDIQKQPV